jgi:hypothetical protein
LPVHLLLWAERLISSKETFFCSKDILNKFKPF